MKTKFSKRILSLFLAVMMVVTSIPMFALTASAAEEDHYLFAYFTGNGNVANSGGVNDQAIRFAVSTDGQTYESVNGGNPVIQQYVGTKNARDPYVFKGQDGKYYCLATDADCDNNSWWGNSSSMVFWRSDDLVNWKDATVINMAQITGKTVYRCWAPQVIWDGNQYMVYFGLAADDYANNGTGNNTHMYYCTTTDLLDQSKYSTPQPLVINSSKDNIDGDITYYNGNYYLFYKDETNATICVIKSSSINSFDASKRIKLDSGSSVGALEGCQVFQNNKGEFIYIADRYSNKGKFVAYNFGTNLDAVLNNATVKNDVKTLSISSYIDNTATSSLTALTPRHGSVLKITADQYTALKTATFTTEVPPDKSIVAPTVPTDRLNEPTSNGYEDNLIARYFVNSNITADVKSSDNKYPLTAAGNGAVWRDSSFNGLGAAYFSSDNYMYTGSVSSMLSSVSAANGITFSFYGLPDSSDAYGRYFEMNSNGTKGSIVWESKGNYISTKATKDGANTIEVETVNNNNFTWCDDTHPTGGRWAGTASYATSQWNQFTVTINDTHVCLYINGELKFDLTRDNAITSAIIDSFKSGGYLLLGASGYNDSTYVGYMRDFRIYNFAVNASQAKELYNDYAYGANYTYQEVKDLLAMYESAESRINTALKNNTVLTNMQSAYDAYVALRKGFDAYYYGGDTSVDIDSLASKFESAYLGMVKWTQYSANNPRPTFSSGTVPDSAFSNILYTNQVDTNKNFEVSHDYSNTEIYHQIGYNQTVLMYDGKNIAKLPVMHITCYNNHNKIGNRGRAVFTVFPTTGDGGTRDLNEMYLTDKWNSTGTWYKKSGDGWNFGKEYGSTSYRMGHNSTTFNQGKEMNEYCAGRLSEAWSEYISSANVLAYNNATSWSTDKSSNDYYFKKYNIWWCFGDEATGTKSSLSSLKLVYGQVSDKSAIYVVNYKALVDAIDTCFAKLPANVNSYKQGGLSAILGAIENATSYNPNSSFATASSASAGVDAFKSKMQSFESALNSATLGSTDVNENEYQALRNAMDKYINGEVSLDESVYTYDSIYDYTKVYDASKSLFRKVVSEGYAQGTYAGECANALPNILNVKLDLSALSAALESLTIYDEFGAQAYTYSSWLSKVGASATTYNELFTETGEYKTRPATVHNSDGIEIRCAVKTTTNNQTDADTAKSKLDGVTLDPVDEADRYQSFDAAYTVANSVDMAKYNADGVKLITDAITDAYKSVYATAGEKNASIYNVATGTNYMTAKTPLKLTTTGATDTFTTALLNAINKANAPSKEDDSIYPFVNQYKAVLNGDKVNAQPKYYGEMFSFTVTADADDIVTWLVTVYATEADMNAALDETGTPTPVNSQVISTYNGATIERKADGFIVFESTVEKATDKPTKTYAYKIYNAYGNVTDVIYSETQYTNETIADQIKTSPKLPFYTFNGWNVGTPDSNNVINVIPNFEINDDVYKTITVNGGTIKLNKSTANHALVGAEATITGNVGTYGWAVETDGKYQIVAYGEKYKFNVLNSEKYVAITTAGDKYYAGGVKLTPTNVAGFSNEYTDATMDDAAYLKAKLDSKAPFVYVQTVDDLTVNETPKKRVYVRVTAGAEENILSYGLELDGQKFNSTAKNDGGQFYLQMNKTTFEAKGSIKAFVNYTFTYVSDAGESAKISRVDYAVVDKEVQ